MQAGRFYWKTKHVFLSHSVCALNFKAVFKDFFKGFFKAF